MKSMADRAANRVEAGAQADERFGFATYDPDAAERRGYSDYSYWGSTLRAFLKNRVALCLLLLLVVLLAFTFIQPYLPGQYDANRINNYPATGLQVNNMNPSMHNVSGTVPADTLLRCTEVKGLDGWYAVTNEILTIPKRTDFTVLEYSEEWCRVSYKGQEGFVKNQRLKLPDDPTQTPYEAKCNFPISLFFESADYTNDDTNSGGYVYVRRADVNEPENGMVRTKAETQLYAFPSTHGFLFGTNSIGQDLWARVWSGTRTSLYIGFMVALTEALIGIVVGVIWGYVRSLDRILTEVYNVLDNIPTTIVLILIAYIMSPSVSTLIFAMCMTRWMGMARFIRNQIIIIRDRDYNIASRCLGADSRQIMIKNLLPYLVSVIMLRMALAIPGAIGSEVFITYIGLGVPLDTPSLGNLINEGRKLFAGAPALRYQLFFPTIILSLVTVSFYIIGNAFADAADPKNHV